MRAAHILPLVGLALVGCDTASDRIGTIVGSCTTAGLTVSPATVTMFIGDSAQLKASLPTCGTVTTPFSVFWRSSNTFVATVDSTGGKVRAVSVGQATIVGVIAADTTVKGAAAISVIARPAGAALP